MTRTAVRPSPPPARATSSSAGRQLAERLLHAADDLFKIGRQLSSAPGGAPGSAALIVPGHESLLWVPTADQSALL